MVCVVLEETTEGVRAVGLRVASLEHLRLGGERRVTGRERGGAGEEEEERERYAGRPLGWESFCLGGDGT